MTHTRGGLRELYYDDVDSDWLPDLFTLKVTTAQHITITTGNTLALGSTLDPSCEVVLRALTGTD
jgi:hypothetical protein